MRLYLKASRMALLKLFRRGSEDDYSRVDSIEEHNAEIKSRIYEGIMQGKMTYCYQKWNNGNNLDVITQSLRGPWVQISHFCNMGGNWEAMSHSEAKEPSRLDLHPGYINIH